MDYIVSEIKSGVKLHVLNTNKFKTNMIAVFLSTPINRECVTYNSMLTAILRRGNNNIKTQEELSKYLEEMYGASFDCGIDKIGKNHVLKFYLESINDEFLPKGSESIFNLSIKTLFDIIFNPLIENEAFKEEYLVQEKENMRQKINSIVDNKAYYARMRCQEEMYKGMPEGIRKFGYVEDIDNINNKNLYSYYKKLINECKIDIFLSGDFREINYNDIIEKQLNEKNIQGREANFVVNKITEKTEVKEHEVKEKMDVAQGKLVIGLDLIFNKKDIDDENIKYKTMIYNGILGGSANSKLFQNVREKESLAYTANSNYIRTNSNIFINCGIEVSNYEKTVEIIKIQLEDMKNGDFTEEDINDVKKAIVSSIDTIEDEQDSSIIYYFTKELEDKKGDLEQYKKQIQDVTKEQVIEISQKIRFNTIYFLENDK